jgi:hypothetical protein
MGQLDLQKNNNGLGWHFQVNINVRISIIYTMKKAIVMQNDTK